MEMSCKWKFDGRYREEEREERKSKRMVELPTVSRATRLLGAGGRCSAMQMQCAVTSAPHRSPSVVSRPCASREPRQFINAKELQLGMTG